jgi:exodeoxyribonuclease III
MKITTWNVNGIRAVIRKGAFRWAQEQDIDVLCLQEVKAHKEQLPEGEQEIPGYGSYWNSAVKGGYSGVAVYTRHEPLDVVYGLGDERFDVEGRVIRLSFPDFYLYNVYFPSGQRGLERVAFKLQFYDCLLNQCSELHRQGKRIIITGDFNTAHKEIDLANPKSNQKTSGFLPEERAWIDRYLEQGFVDVFRHKYPDKVQYTWWTYTSFARTRNVGWRLDYFLLSQALVGFADGVVIHDDVLGSDHCPVSLLITPEKNRL